MTTYEDAANNPGLMPYRVRQLESFRRDLEAWRQGVDDDRREIKYMQTQIDDVLKELRGIRTALVRFALSVAGAAVVFGLSILSATGKI